MKFEAIVLAVFSGITLVFVAGFSQPVRKHSNIPAGTDYRATAPNGEILADDIYGLKAIVSSSVAAKIGRHTEFAITGISYIKNNYPSGVIASVEFRTEKGISSNVLLCKNIPAEKIIVAHSPLLENTGEDRLIKISCSGNTNCQVQVHTGDNNKVEVNCTCSPCIINVE